MRSSLAGALAKIFLLFMFGTLVVACPDKKPKYPVCKKDKDCKDGEKCINGQCLQCGADSDCPDGKVCKAGACTFECESSADCADGKVCKANQCVGCESDTECGADKRCSNGACLGRGACNVDEDCADDEDCIGGQCQRPGRSGAPDVSCKLDSVYFGFDQYSIEGEAKTVIETNLECVKQAPEDKGLMLYGHTDPRGTEEYNIALAEKRANAVADFLARLGIDPARLNVVSKGEGEATGTSEESWAKDRRVDFEWK